MSEQQPEGLAKSEPAHSKLGASSGYRWKACPGSVRLCENIPSTSSIWAEEGTRAHELAARVLLGEDPTQIVEGTAMREAIGLYAQTVIDDYLLERKYQGPGPDNFRDLYVEQRLDLSAVYPKCFGTGDAIILDWVQKILRVYDFKYGKGVHVDAENNFQLLYYALGAALKFNFPVDKCECVIVQPRCKSKSGLVRRWRFDGMVLLDFWAELVEAATRTEAPDAPLIPGRHCYFCPAKPKCPALHGEALQQAQDIFGVIPMESAHDVFTERSLTDESEAQDLLS